MLEAQAGQFLVNDTLPKPLRDYNRVYDQKGLNSVLEVLAKEYPDQYKQVSKKLADLGGEVAYRQGGLTFGLDHLLRPKEADTFIQSLRQKVHEIHSDPKLSPEQRSDQVSRLLQDSRQKIQELSYGTALKANNPLALQASLGFRGDPDSINAMIGADTWYPDASGKPIPIPILKSYSQGLTPFGLFASSFGSRQGVAATKTCLHEDQLVLMADWSTKPMKEIVVGDFVMGANKKGQLYPVRVKAVYFNGPRDCYEYCFRLGRSTTRKVSLICTEDHNVLAVERDSNKLVANSPPPALLPMRKATLKPNSWRNKFSAYVSRGALIDNGIEVPEALLAGLMIGDGCMSPSVRGRYQFSCADLALVKDIEEYLTTLGLCLRKSNAKNHSWNLCAVDPTRSFCRSTNGRVLEGHIVPAKNWLREKLGWKKAKDKTLPVDVWSWSNSSVVSLLNGIYSTDGNVTDGRQACVRLFMTSPYVVAEVKKLLELRFGIWCSETVCLPPTRTKTAKSPLYGFRILSQESLLRFCQLFSLVGKKKQAQAKLLSQLQQGRNDELTCKIDGKSFFGFVNTMDLEVDSPDHMFALANGIIVSNSTAEAGALNKQITQAAHRVIISDDTDEGDWYKSDVPRGLPVKVDDPGNVGTLLAHDVGPFKRNTILTPKLIEQMKQQGFEDILVRSPIVGGHADGGIHARDAGIRNKSTLPYKGFVLGVQSGQGIGEPLTQLQLSKKHGGAVGGSRVSGFKFIEAMANPPKEMPFGAAHAQDDGRVERIVDNAAGGKDVFINGKKHYVSSDNQLQIKEGDMVEAGDVISDGTPNPREVVKHKGVGEGRNYLLNTLYKSYRENKIGSKMLRRNLEPVVRGIVNHVQLNDFWNGHAPDDVVNYNYLESKWQPRQGSEMRNVSDSIGRYLETPVLHYTVGTKIRPSVVNQLKKFKIDSTLTHAEPPPFTPHMLRATDNLQYDPDWQVRLGGQYLQRGLLDAAHRGMTSSPNSTSFMPALMQGKDITKGLTSQL